MQRPRFESLFTELTQAFEQAVGASKTLSVDIDLTLEEAIQGCEKQIQTTRLDHCRACGGDRGRPGCPLVTCPRCAGEGRRELRAVFVSVGLETKCNLCLGQGRVPTEPCVQCRGVGLGEVPHTVRVPLPAGIRSGETRSVTGAGHRLRPGAAAGPLTIRVAVLTHAIFDRQGSNLRCSVPVSFPRATLGGIIEVPTLDGSTSMKVPPGTGSGSTLKLRGEGLPRRFGRGRGDQIVTVLLEVPREVSGRGRAILHQLATELDTRKRKRRRGVVGRVRNWLR